MLPQKCKNINLYNESASHLGIIAAYNPIKISHSMEEWRGGGSIGPVMIDNGLEALTFEWTLGGWNSQVVNQLGAVAIDGVLLRAMAAMQADDGSPVSAVEAVVLGRHQEIDFGEFKPGGDTEKKIKTVASYYKLSIDGQELLEIDMPAGVYKVNGVDRYAEIRAALGG